MSDIENEEISGLTPKKIVAALGKYIIGQNDAKRAVAIAIRNRARRKLVPDDMKDEIAPKNIIMIGKTGVGKTEIARRLSVLTNAPFVKVEATKFTEVGYMGRDVESMVRDLMAVAIDLVAKEQKEKVRTKAEHMVEERLLDILLPPPDKPSSLYDFPDDDVVELDEDGNIDVASDKKDQQIEMDSYNRTRDKFRKKLANGDFEDKIIDIDVKGKSSPLIEISANDGMIDFDNDIRNMISNMMPGNRKQRKLSVKNSRKILIQQEMEALIDMDTVTEQAIYRVENGGMIFIDEIDKIAGKHGGSGPDVSREGVQRDILPIVEGSTVNTKYGSVKTDHILFIAAGAFTMSKPSDLIPELQGRFPIRVELESLTRNDLKRILTKPKNALIKQYEALLATEGIKLKFNAGAIDEIAKIAEEVNNSTENIGARRLHTLMENLLDEISFNAPEYSEKDFVVSREYVKEKLANLLEDRDSTKYIL